MIPYPIEPHNPWNRGHRKKSLFELVEEEEMFARIIAEQNAHQSQPPNLQTQDTAVNAGAGGAGGLPSYEYFHPLIPTEMLLIISHPGNDDAGTPYYFTNQDGTWNISQPYSTFNCNVEVRAISARTPTLYPEIYVTTSLSSPQGNSVNLDVFVGGYGGVDPLSGVFFSYRNLSVTSAGRVGPSLCYVDLSNIGLSDITQANQTYSSQSVIEDKNYYSGVSTDVLTGSINKMYSRFGVRCRYSFTSRMAQDYITHEKIKFFPPNPTSDFSIFSSSNQYPPIVQTSINFTNKTQYSGNGNLTYVWNFGDGSPYTYTTNAFHEYTDGCYTASLTVIDSINNIPSTKTQYMVVTSNVIAGFIMNTPPVAAPFTASFFNTSFNAKSQSWSFGDDSPVTNSVHPTHFYTTSGSITASLQITGSSGSVVIMTDTSSAFYLSASFFSNVYNEIASRISNVTPDSTSYEIYSVSIPETKTYVRNPNLWANSADWTCFPGYGASGVLVAPDVFLGARHASGYSSGSVIHFVDNNNTTITSSMVTGSFVSGSGDIWISILTPPVSASIKPAKILPKTAFLGSNVKLPSSVISDAILPVITTNQFDQMGISVLNFSFVDYAYVVQSSNPIFKPWHFVIIGGDSGYPQFLILNGETIALFTWLGATMGPNIAYFDNEINNTLINLGSTSSLSYANTASYWDSFVNYLQ